MSTMENVATGEFVGRVALLWQKILRVDHASIFAGAPGAAIDRPHGHDRLPQPGYVGVRYRPGGILLLGQNPGNDPIGKGQSAEDLQQYEILYRLKDVPDEAAAVAVARELMAALAARVMRTWPIVRNLVEPLLTDLGIELSDVAYTNLVKFRTSRSKIDDCIYDASWPCTLQQIELLDPANIILLGLETRCQFARLYLPCRGVDSIRRTRNDAYLSPEGRMDIQYIAEKLRRSR